MSRKGPFQALLAALSAALSVGVPAAASDGAPESVTTVYSPYELVAIKKAEQKWQSTVDPDPEGKIIESIDTLRLDPIEERDPAPMALNARRSTTSPEAHCWRARG